MRKGDNHWHCQCGTWCFEKTESTVDRKRKAEDTELELHKADCEDAAPGFVTVVRPVQEPENTETLWQIPIQSMWSSIAGCVKTMSSSVKEWFSKLGARLTKTAYEAVETRRYDETGSHLVVKRLKRQYCLPVASSSARQEEVLFEQLPYFEWADDATDRIGKHALESIKSAFWRQVLDIRRGYIAFKSSIDELKAQHKEGEFDLDLSIAIYNLMIRDFEDVSMTNYVAAAGQYEQGAMTVVSFIDQVYLESDILPALKEVFSKPPKQLDYFGDFEFKSRTRLAGDFLTWLLTQKDLFRIDESFQDALAKLVVDMDAIHKQEVLPSLVQFPGNNKPIMPGSFPLEDDILEVVPADKLIIEPVYECKHPDPRPPVSKPTAASSPASTKTQVQGEAEPWSIPKSILKKGTRKTVGNPLPRMQGTLTTPSRVRKLQFASPVARFTPPKRLPRTARVTKASSINNARTGLHGSPSGSRALSALTNIYHSTIKQAYQGTKYANFLNDTLRELYRRQDFSLPTISWPTKLHQNMQAKRQAWLKMSEEERQREMDLFVRDLELDDSGNVVRRQLLVPESELIIATRGLKDLRLANQVRREMEEAAEKERERMIKIIADEKRRKLEEEKRKIAEERRRLEEEEEKKRESERQKEEERLRAEQEAQRIREAEERAARRRLRAPTRAIIAPVTDEWRTRVLEIADSQPGVELTKTLEGQALTRRDFEEKLLPATAWLNDNVITGSILYIGDYVNRKLGATTQHPKCATFTSYFWPRLESAGPTQCGRLMRRAGVRKDNFLNIDSVLIPICKSSHWTLAVVLPSRRVIAHMDSLRGGHGDPYVTGLLREWVKATLQELYVEDEWEVVDFDAPMQLNGWDCGVFTITNGICMALGVDPKQSYSADQLTLQRHRLAAVLLNGGFQGDFDLDGV
ncbi:hypothetical protein VTK73DRAFT_5420 [Phialemonium thermophilum]|uniref:Ubiquitin-like protease family profile domain-containing protein n=1 Tax=Phialemonium thermophilum TaxID=223376 RepID=A0ABR3WPE7_9PEZI